MTTVAVLGTGTIGEPIARNLARSGFDVRTWNRTREKAEPLAPDGATVCDSAAEAANDAELVLTVLADVDATEETVAEVEFADGATWIQMATVGVRGAERLAELAREKGAAFVDAPVLGTRLPGGGGQAGRPGLRPRRRARPLRARFRRDRPGRAGSARSRTGAS